VVTCSAPGTPGRAGRGGSASRTRINRSATSGTAERGAHVIDPHTGRPPSGLTSVTVVGPRLSVADAYATAAFAMGAAARDWLDTLDGYDAFAVGADASTWSTGRLGEAV
jgi:thiamine biosynthesis lipoprotein